MTYMVSFFLIKYKLEINQKPVYLITLKYHCYEPENLYKFPDYLLSSFSVL
jgi:hypothetical protein